MIITRQSGNLEFYTLPDCELRFKDKNFASAPRCLESGRFEGAEGRRGDVPVVQEINMFFLGPSNIPHFVVIIARVRTEIFDQKFAQIPRLKMSKNEKKIVIYGSYPNYS